MYVVLCQQSQLEEMHILLPLLMTSRGVVQSNILRESLRCLASSKSLNSMYTMIVTKKEVTLALHLSRDSRHLMKCGVIKA